MKSYAELPKPIISSLAEIRATYDGNDIWILDSGWNAVFKANKDFGDIQCVAEITEQLTCADPYSFERIIKNNNKLFLIPCKADDIYVFDTKDLSIEKLGISFDTKVLNVIPILADGSLFCISRKPDLIIQINDEGIRKYEVDNNSEADRSIMSGRFRTQIRLETKGNWIMIPYLVRDIVTYFNVTSGDFYSKRLGVIIEDDDFIIGCCKVDIIKYYFYTRKGKLIISENDNCYLNNAINNALDEMYRQESFAHQSYGYIMRCYFINDCLWCIFANIPEIFVYDIKHDDVLSIKNPFISNDNDLIGIRECYTDSLATDEKIFIWNENIAHTIFALNIDSMDVELVEAKWNMDKMTKKKLLLSGKSIVLKDDLKGLIDLLCSD